MTTSTFFANRAQLTLEGINVQGFAVGRGNLVGIMLNRLVKQKVMRGFRTTPNSQATVPQDMNAMISFSYMFKNDDAMFDFSTFPFTSNNYMMTLQDINGKDRAVFSGMYFNQDILTYKSPGVPATMIVNLGALNAYYIP